MTNDRVNEVLLALDAPGYIKSFHGVRWHEFRGFFEELFRDTEVEEQVLRDLDNGTPQATYNGVVLATVLEVCVWDDVRMSAEGLSNLGRFLRLLEAEGEDSLYWKTGTIMKSRAAVSSMPSAYIGQLDPKTATDVTWLHHLASVAEMNRAIPYDYVVAVGDRQTSSCVASLFDRGVPAEYARTFRTHRWADAPRVATAEHAWMMADAFDRGIGADYLGGALKLGVEFPEILRMAEEGVAFEYLAAYYERETV